MKTKEVQIKKVDDCLAVAELLEKRKTIAAQIADLDAQIMTVQREGDIDTQAAAVLAGGDAGAPQAALDTLHHKRRVLKAALQQLDVQVQDARSTATSELSQVYVPEYKALSARTLDAMKLLKGLLIEERAFFDRMRSAGMRDYFKERQDVCRLIGGAGQESHVDHSLLHKHIIFRQG